MGPGGMARARSKVLGEPDLPPLTARLTRDPDVVRWLKAEPGATVAVNAAVDELEILLDRHNGNVDAAERGSLRLHRVQGIDGVWEFYRSRATTLGERSVSCLAMAPSAWRFSAATCPTARCHRTSGPSPPERGPETTAARRRGASPAALGGGCVPCPT